MYKNFLDWLCRPLALCAALALPLAAGAQEVPDHVVVVIEENHSYDEIIGNTAEAPNLNALAQLGAIFTNSHAIEHPSQPNYLDIFSGFNQGVTGDTISSSQFTTANLAAELHAVGKTFAVYSETLPPSLPSDRKTAVPPGTTDATAEGYLGTSYSDDFRLNEYERKHNPASNWQNDLSNDTTDPTSNQLPASVNQPWSAFPTTDTGFATMPTVSFVVPNEQHDIHDGTIAQGDNFLSPTIQNYATWALTHNSLLVITFDENDDEDGNYDLTAFPALATNQIPTVIIGQNVVKGSYAETPGVGINHYNLLQTLQDFYGTAHAGATALSSGGVDPFPPITDIFAGATPAKASFLAFATTAYLAKEHAGSVPITVQRAGSSQGAVSVNYATVPGAGLGAAKAGSSYEDTTGTLSWADGDMAAKTFTVKVRDRGLSDRSTRTFHVVLSAASGANLGLPHRAKVIIKENDPPPAAVTPAPTP